MLWRTSKLCFLPVSAPWRITEHFTYSLRGEVGILIPIFQMSNWNSERLSHLPIVTQLVNDKFWLQTQLLLTPHLRFFSIMVCYQFTGDDKGGQAQALVESFSFQPSRTVRIITKSSFEIHITSVVKTILSGIFNFRNPGIGDGCRHFQVCLRRVFKLIWSMSQPTLSSRFSPVDLLCQGFFTLDILEITCCWTW